MLWRPRARVSPTLGLTSRCWATHLDFVLKLPDRFRWHWQAMRRALRRDAAGRLGARDLVFLALRSIGGDSGRSAAMALFRCIGTFPLDDYAEALGQLLRFRLAHVRSFKMSCAASSEGDSLVDRAMSRAHAGRLAQARGGHDPFHQWRSILSDWRRAPIIGLGAGRTIR